MLSEIGVQLGNLLGLGKCPRSLARRSPPENVNAANFQLAKTHYMDSLPSEQAGSSSPTGICSVKMHKGGRLNKPFQISRPGESFILSSLLQFSFDRQPFKILGDCGKLAG